MTEELTIMAVRLAGLRFLQMSSPNWNPFHKVDTPPREVPRQTDLGGEGEFNQLRWFFNGKNLGSSVP